MATILVLHGPNLNLLGKRERDLYGAATLDEINRQLTDMASSAGHALICQQSQAEHTLIEHIHRAAEQKVACIIFNPAAYTHTSIALRDALLAVAIPFIEVHISAIQAREPYRHGSYFSDIARGVVTGFGSYSYTLAMHAALHLLTEDPKERSYGNS